MKYVCTASGPTTQWPIDKEGILQVPPPVLPLDEGEWVLAVAPAFVQRGSYGFVLWTWTELNSAILQGKQLAERLEVGIPSLPDLSPEQQRCLAGVGDYQCQKAAGHDDVHFNIAYGSFETPKGEAAPEEGEEAPEEN